MGFLAYCRKKCSDDIRYRCAQKFSEREKKEYINTLLEEVSTFNIGGELAIVFIKWGFFSTTTETKIFFNEEIIPLLKERNSDSILPKMLIALIRKIYEQHELTDKQFLKMHIFELYQFDPHNALNVLSFLHNHWSDFSEIYTYEDFKPLATAYFNSNNIVDARRMMEILKSLATTSETTQDLTRTSSSEEVPERIRQVLLQELNE